MILYFLSSNSTTWDDSPTNLSHLGFGLQGSEKTYHFRKYCVESWWRPGKTRGFVYLDRAPEGDLLPWSEKSPPYRIVDNISQLLEEINVEDPLIPRMVHGILELFREEQEGLRWLIMGDDDTAFLLDNLVDVLSGYDHTKYYYIGYPSKFVLSNYWYSFNQAFGGGGIILSYPAVKALVNDMDRCLRTYSNFSADLLTMSCLADLGVDLTPLMGVHQIDLRGALWGFWSSHPKDLVLALHHIRTVDPYFPSMNHGESLHLLMKAGNVDQSRLFQQTICHRREKQWSFSITWGYSAHIYERIMTRNWLIAPIQTFLRWQPGRKTRNRRHYKFNTRRPSSYPLGAILLSISPKLMFTLRPRSELRLIGRSAVMWLVLMTQARQRSNSGNA